MKIGNTLTVIDIAERFEEAAFTLKRLPPVKVQGYFNCWPEVVLSVAEKLQQDRLPQRLGPPPPDAISRMEETIQWMFILSDEDERKLVWMRAENIPWKIIQGRIGCGRTKAWYMWRVAICKIEHHLKTQKNNKNWRR